jgi:hypothetical protein
LSQTLATVLPLFVEHHHKTVSKVFFEAEGISPILAAFEAKRNPGNGGGRKFILSVDYLIGSTASATFSISQAKAQGATTGSAPLATRFEIDPVKMENVAVVDRDAIDGAEGDSEKMVDVLERAQQRGVLGIRNKLAYQVCERGWGRVGTILAVTSSTITLDPSVLNRFEVGAELTSSTSENGAVLKNSAGAIRVTAKNSDTGVVTMASDPTAGTAWAVNDTVFMAGDRENSATPARLCITGLRAWLDHTSASDTLHGVARAGNEGLLGYRVDGTNLTIAAALLKGAFKLHKNGSPNATEVFISDEDFYELAADKDVQKNVEIKMGPYEISFSGVSVIGPNGKSIKVVSDANLEAGVAYMGPWNSKEERPFIFHNNPELVSIDDKAGQIMYPLASSTAYEMRFYFRGNAVIPTPGRYCAIYNLGATS